MIKKKDKRIFKDTIIIQGEFTIRDDLSKDPLFSSKKGKHKIKDILDKLF